MVLCTLTGNVEANPPIGVDCLTKWLWEECNPPTAPSTCLRIETPLCRPQSGPVSCPSLLDPSVVYRFVILTRCY